MDKKFDYNKALQRLEKIAAQVEDPATPLGDIASLVKESRSLIDGCREYLRSVREDIENQ